MLTLRFSAKVRTVPEMKETKLLKLRVSITLEKRFWVLSAEAVKKRVFERDRNVE